MRKHLTTLIWYKDRLCTLSSAWLAALNLLCLAGLGVLIGGTLEWLDELALLIAENELLGVVILFGILALTTAVLWVLSASLGALCRRAALYLRGF